MSSDEDEEGEQKGEGGEGPEKYPFGVRLFAKSQFTIIEQQKGLANNSKSVQK